MKSHALIILLMAGPISQTKIYELDMDLSETVSPKTQKVAAPEPERSLVSVIEQDVQTVESDPQLTIQASPIGERANMIEPVSIASHSLSESTSRLVFGSFSSEARADRYMADVADKCPDARPIVRASDRTPRTFRVMSGSVTDFAAVKRQAELVGLEFWVMNEAQE